jgi:hypothetical protein
MNKKIEQKFRDIYEKTLENVDLQYLGNLKNIDYFGLFCKATAQDKLYRFLGLNTCMFNYIHEKEESVMIIFSIPNGEESTTKFVADKVMDIVELCESVFVTVDFIKSKEIKDDKFIYVTVIKKMNNDN